MKNPAMAAAALLLLAMSCSSEAAPTSCPDSYAAGIAPDILKPKLAERTAELCFEGFGVVHSGVAAIPLWSAERLTAERVTAAKAVDRVDRFHAEGRLPARDRSELSHYRGSGYDRGHLSPAADMDTPESQDESFSLANMVPQDPALNRVLWAHIEATARGLALAYGEVYAVTGVAFSGAQVRQVGGRVLVPGAVYKAVYVPKASAAAAWWAPNEEPGDRFEVISIDELTARTGIDVFPGIPAGVKAIGARLPEPSAMADRRAGTGQARAAVPEKKAGRARDSNASGSAVWKSLAAKALRELVR